MIWRDEPDLQKNIDALEKELKAQHPSALSAEEEVMIDLIAEIRRLQGLLKP